MRLDRETPLLTLECLTPPGDTRTRQASFLARDSRTRSLVVAYLSKQGRALDVSQATAFCMPLAAMPEGRIASPLDPIEDANLGTLLLSEFVPGVPLRVFSRAQKLPFEAAAGIFLELVTLVGALHENGGFHGDLHSNNVLCDADGSLVLVGQLQHPALFPSSTLGSSSHARRYTSPEVLEGRPPSAAGDVYSLGLLGFELFTGRPLLPRGDAEGTRKNQIQIQKALSKVDRISRSVPPNLSRALCSMLQIEPEARPSLDAAFVDSLLDSLESIELPENLDQVLSSLLPRVFPLYLKAKIHDAEASLRRGDGTAAVLQLRHALDAPGSILSESLQSLKETIFRCFWKLLPKLYGKEDFSERDRYAFQVLEDLGKISQDEGLERILSIAAARVGRDDDQDPFQEMEWSTVRRPKRIQDLKAGTLDLIGQLELALMTPTLEFDQALDAETLRPALEKAYQQEESPSNVDFTAPESDVRTQINELPQSAEEGLGSGSGDSSASFLSSAASGASEEDSMFDGDEELSVIRFPAAPSPIPSSAPPPPEARAKAPLTPPPRPRRPISLDDDEDEDDFEIDLMASVMGAHGPTVPPKRAPSDPGSSFVPDLLNLMTDAVHEQAQLDSQISGIRSEVETSGVGPASSTPPRSSTPPTPSPASTSAPPPPEEPEEPEKKRSRYPVPEIFDDL